MQPVVPSGKAVLAKSLLRYQQYHRTLQSTGRVPYENIFQHSINQWCSPISKQGPTSAGLRILWNKLLTHYGSNTGMGIHMQLSMELLITKAGVSLQPLTTPFNRWKNWVIHCWLKSVWEKVGMFLVRVEISDLPLHFTRERDNWLMGAFEHADYDEKSLVHLNRVRCHQQALFISDVLDASGKAIDRRYMTRRQRGET
jgi:hypothetical protein